MKRLFLLLFSFVLTAIFFSIVDRTALRTLADRNEIPRFERQTTTTPEFHYTADINSAGYRSEEFSADASDRGELRIVTLGDSFTYGWGVEETNSWPRILESILRQEGFRARVLNLGKPGDTPHSYARTAFRMLPKLKPDLVIAAILQGDDIAQLNKTTVSDLQAISHSQNPTVPTPTDPAPSSAPKTLAKNIFKWLYPNLVRLRDLRSRTQITAISSIWKDQVHNLLAAATAEERERYNRLPADARKLYEEGGLNPSLLRLALTRPNYFSETWDLTTPFTSNSIAVLSACLDTIRLAANAQRAHALALSIPYGMYTTKSDWGNWRNVGFEVFPEMLTLDNADTAIARAASEANVEFFSVLHPFRTEAQGQSLYYKFDGHFNPDGHRIFAQLIAVKIAPILQAIEHEKSETP